MNEKNEKLTQEIQKIKENVIDQIDDYRSIMKSYFALPFPKEYKKLDIIYAHLNTIVRGLGNTQFNQHYLKITYSEDEISEMVNEIICYYLLAWIELFANTRQTIPSFSKQRYELSENQVRHKSGEDTYETKDDDMSSIYRGLAIYQTITFENISHLKNEISNTTRYKTYNFLELCFAECYSHYYINLLRYLAYYKEPLKIISNTKKQTAIEDGYKQYFSFLEDIKNEKDDVVFTDDAYNLFCTRITGMSKNDFSHYFQKYAFEIFDAKKDRKRKPGATNPTSCLVGIAFKGGLK